MGRREYPTQERLRELLVYNPDTGVITRRINSGPAKSGDVAGSIGNHGYIQISVDNRPYLAHRIAWAYTFGFWPENHIDHIDGDKLNNRLSNLREATCSENLRNAKLRKSNTSGRTGVYWSRVRSKWVAQISVNRKVINLGGFVHQSDAIAARRKAEIEMHGEFACQNQ